jgi:chromosomal replication initiation ATPase DnaA
MMADPLLERLIQCHRPAPPWRYEPKSFNRRITGMLGNEPWQNGIIYDPSPQEIIAAVTDYYQLPGGHLVSRVRTKLVCRARIVALFLCRRLTSLQNTEIAAAFNRERTSVWYAYQTITEMKQTDAALGRDIWNLQSMFGRLN